ncbi:hypothetical protein ABGN05_20045 [Aquibium sp. LZ166]|uniref:Uncharacterized protein n=1 Tax=Aquibium pacificus TaxID=3153579 RepID=A0ABV3SMF5_9HYPH
MKIRPLPEIDLARIAPQPDDMKRRCLEQMRDGRPPFSYKPVRSCLADIFNVQPELFGPTAHTEWAVIDEILNRRCRTEDELLNNRRVARGLFEFALSSGVSGRRHEFFPLQLGAGQKVTYWLPMILAVDDRPHAVFIEPRRSRGLTKEGRRFAFSMMHERIRAADEDFADVGLAILGFHDGDTEKRPVRLFTDEGVDLYVLDELEAMVAATYRIWENVCVEREHDTRKGTGTGPLL